MPEPEIRALLSARQWERAFELIVAEYQGKVFRLAYAVLGNRAHAEDAAQEAFLRAWRALDRYNGAATVSTWLYAITRNTALSLREFHARRRRADLASIAEPSAPAPADPENELGTWSPACPMPIAKPCCSSTWNANPEEAARMLGIPEGTLKTHLHRARKLLGASMEKEA